MAYPPGYVRAYSFTDFETLNPGEPKPGNKLDTEYDAVSNAITGTQTALALIQRADGALANESVGVDQLQAGLFDGIGDAATADAEAAAAAAAASAAAAATSAAEADAFQQNAGMSADAAGGYAAQAGVSQSIAQTAAVDAGTAADDAGDAADAAELAANSTQNSVAEAQLHEEMSFKWAEYLTGPVMPAPPGWPEAVDDGMFSSKWWAIRARNYNAVHHIDLGTAGTNPGEAFVIWDAIPGNDLANPPGLVYATWGTPPRTYVLVDPFDPSDPNSWMDITGADGPPGPPNTLTIGTVTTGAPSAATITGTSPNQVLNLRLEQGPVGPPGPAGSGSVGNPTALVGLTPVNGVAVSAIRSDGAPALSQAIVPTWTGAHTFNALVNLVGPLQATSVDGISGQVLASQGAGLAPVWRTPGGGAIEILWNFSTAVGTANPGSQKMSLNSAVYTSVTTAVFNSLAQTNFDANAILGLLSAGNRIYMQQRNDATKAVVYQVTGVATNAGGYWTVPVTHVNSLGVVMFPANVDVVCVFIMSASGGGTVAGANTQIQYNNLGAFGASAGFTWTDGTATLQLGTGAQSPIIQPAQTGAGTAPSFTLRGGIGASGNKGGNVTLQGGSPANGDGGDVALTAWSGTGAGKTGGNVNITSGASADAAGVNGFIQLQAAGSNAANLGYIVLRTGASGINKFYLNGNGSWGLGAVATVGTAGQSLTSQAGAPPIWSNPALVAANFANPSATIGLANVNGSAVTAMRSDAAPALSQAIAPTWTGQHAWSLPLRAPDGTAALPAYTFGSDLDTGICRPGVNRLDIATAGGSHLAINDNAGVPAIDVQKGVFRIPDGLPGSPSLTFFNDPDTGFYRNGANDFLAVAGGVLIGRFLNLSGAAQFLVANGTAASPSFTFNVDNDTGMWSSTANTIDWAVGGVNTMELNSTTLFGPSFSSSSSRAIKRETGAPSKVRDILARLRPILYRMLVDESHEQLGLIAEEVHEVCPQLSDGKTVCYDRLAILLLAAWQDEHVAAA